MSLVSWIYSSDLSIDIGAQQIDGANGPRLMLTVLRLQQFVEQLGACLGRGVTSTADKVEFLPELIVSEPSTLGSEDILALIRARHCEAISHIHIIMLVEGRIVMEFPEGVDLVEYLWRNGVVGQFADDILTALLRAVLTKQVEHTEFEGLTLVESHVEGDLVHVINGCRHDERVLLAHHHTVELSKV